MPFYNEIFGNGSSSTKDDIFAGFDESYADDLLPELKFEELDTQLFSIGGNSTMA